MTRIRLALLAVLVVPLSAPAAPPPSISASGAKPAPTKPLVLTPGMKRPVMSPEGRTIAARIWSTPDARMTELQSQISAMTQQRMQLISAAPVDIDQLERLLREEELLQTELRARKTDRLMLLLRSLPEADRYPALQNLMNPVKLQSSKPAGN